MVAVGKKTSGFHTETERVTALPKKLTRAELIDHIVERFKIHKTEVNLLLELVFDDIKQALGDGRIVELRSFGTFEIHIRAQRKARNPRTGEKLMAEERGTVFFRPGREMKNLVKKTNGKKPDQRTQTDAADALDKAGGE
jgi:nucleoid DNA-binding protein